MKDKEKADFLPRKYWDYYFGPHCTHSDYDHPMLFRDADYDYFVVSLYPGKRNEEILKEGFIEIEKVYNESCRSYMKKFKRVRSQRLEPVDN